VKPYGRITATSEERKADEEKASRRLGRARVASQVPGKLRGRSSAGVCE
jgi:hypothetical protein